MKYIALFLLVFTSNINAKTLPINLNFSANFSQTIINKDNTLHYEGEMKSDENSIYYRYILPERKRICANKYGIKVIDDDLEQVTLHKEKFMIKAILEQAKIESKDNYLATYQGITYKIYAPNGEVKTINYLDELENQVTISLSPAEVKVDCSYPANYDEVER